jgi:hypothetical protein
VRVLRTPENMGLVGHLDRLVKLSEGRIIIGNAGDDISLPGRARPSSAPSKTPRAISVLQLLSNRQARGPRRL